MEEKKFRIALLGLGTVGSKVAEILYHQKEKIRQSSGYSVELVYGYVRSVDQNEKQELANKYQFHLTESIDEILEDETIDVVIELLGRINPAKTFIEKALQAKKSVITANKDIIAQYGYELNQLAINSGVWLVYEASVAGGIPIVDTLETHFAFDEIKEITGIMNGTTNYILSQMYQEKLGYEEALLKAQALGFAESNPTNDVEGIDAAYKVMVLAQLAFQTYIQLEDVKTKGITNITFEQLNLAAKFGYRIKLLGQLQRIEDAFYFRVEPFFVPIEHLLANVSNEINALAIVSEQIGHTFISGPGAGPAPTAASVLADVFRLLITKENMKILARDTQSMVSQPTEIHQNSCVLIDKKSIKNRYGVLVNIDNEDQSEMIISNKWIKKNAFVSDNQKTIMWLETNELSMDEYKQLEQKLDELGSILSFLPITD